MDKLLSELLDEADTLPASMSAEVPAADLTVPVTGATTMAGSGVAYDASDIVDKLGSWQPPLRSADADLLPEKGIIDARARDTSRNDAYVASGATLHKDNIVGSRYLLNCKPKTKLLFGSDDDAWEQEFQEEVETKFTLWAESPSHWVDAGRSKTLTDMVRLAVGVHCSGGEVLATGEWMRDDGRPYRTAVQMIDADRLSTPWDHLRRSNRKIRNGVERDKYGAPRAYHIKLTHESDLQYDEPYHNAFKWKRVAARKPWGRQMILHVFEQLRPDQTRGISSMATALTEMRMTKRFRQTELERAIIASTYAATIETELPGDQIYTAMGGGDEANPAVKWSTDYLAAVAEFSGGSKNMHINGSRIPMFFPGTSLRVQNPGAESPQGDKFEQSLLRYIAASLDVSYEQLSKDFTNTNYSGFRGAMGETRKAMMSRKRKAADGTANFIYRLWLEEAIGNNDIESLKRKNVPAFYDGLNAEAYSSCEWIGAGDSLIDPLKETQADVLAIRNGLVAKEAVIARRSGSDWREVAKQIARERKLDESLGNPSIYDRDATDMENALSGTPQERES